MISSVLSPTPFTLACLCLLLLLGGACTNENQQAIDLSDDVVERPVDGVGHYVYALNLPRTVAPGERFEVQMEWRTVGSVDPNARYTMDVVLEGPQRKAWSIPAGANTVGELHLANWLSYPFEVPADFTAGEYRLGVRLRNERRDGEEVPMGYVADRKMDEGFYRLAELRVE
ncbi:hypothetical protein [Lewinella sp. IMCC34183]|uniref:hypothetical protein n=1 Tax=Lewinella sp. IMCC34183 TaxID=2248762 RepID=UPI001300411F|nr:hypothetical protein [Lewinella sp. IMCC34183]